MNISQRPPSKLLEMNEKERKWREEKEKVGYEKNMAKMLYMRTLTGPVCKGACRV